MLSEIAVHIRLLYSSSKDELYIALTQLQEQIEKDEETIKILQSANCMDRLLKIISLYEDNDDILAKASCTTVINWQHSLISHRYYCQSMWSFW
jgi:hypothetical protein